MQSCSFFRISCSCLVGKIHGLNSSGGLFYRKILHQTNGCELAFSQLNPMKLTISTKLVSATNTNKFQGEFGLFGYQAHRGWEEAALICSRFSPHDLPGSCELLIAMRTTRINSMLISTSVQEGHGIQSIKPRKKLSNLVPFFHIRDGDSGCFVEATFAFQRFGVQFTTTKIQERDKCVLGSYLCHRKGFFATQSEKLAAKSEHAIIPGKK